MLPVSTIGITVSRVKPIEARGLKFVPRTVISAPSATVEGVICRDMLVLCADICALTSRPKVTMTPSSPPRITAPSTSVLTQKSRGGRLRPFSHCCLGIRIYSSGRGSGVTGIRGSEGVRGGRSRSSTTLCQFVLRLPSSNNLVIRAGEGVVGILLSGEKRGERCASTTVFSVDRSPNKLISLSSALPLPIAKNCGIFSPRGREILAVTLVGVGVNVSPQATQKFSKFGCGSSQIGQRITLIAVPLVHEVPLFHHIKFTRKSHPCQPYNNFWHILSLHIGVVIMAARGGHDHHTNKKLRSAVEVEKSNRGKGARLSKPRHSIYMVLWTRGYGCCKRG